MEITKVDVTIAKSNDPKFKGYAEATIDGGFLIKGMRIINGEKGLFIAMPSRERRQKEGEVGTYKQRDDIVHPLNEEVRKMFTEKILEEYYKKCE